MPKEKSLDGLDAFDEINSPNALVILQTLTQSFLLSSVVDVAYTCKLLQLEFPLLTIVLPHVFHARIALLTVVPLSFNHQ